MISYSMKKYKLLIIILILTIFLFGIVFLLNDRTRYNNLVKSNEEWNEVISKGLESDNVSIESMSFNDYPLIVDNEHNKIYYSFVESAKKYNPFVKFNGNIALIIVNIKVTHIIFIILPFIFYSSLLNLNRLYTSSVFWHIFNACY